MYFAIRSLLLATMLPIYLMPLAQANQPTGPDEPDVEAVDAANSGVEAGESPAAAVGPPA